MASPQFRVSVDQSLIDAALARVRAPADYLLAGGESSLHGSRSLVDSQEHEGYFEYAMALLGEPEPVGEFELDRFLRRALSSSSLTPASEDPPQLADLPVRPYPRTDEAREMHERLSEARLQFLAHKEFVQGLYIERERLISYLAEELGDLLLKPDMLDEGAERGVDRSAYLEILNATKIDGVSLWGRPAVEVREILLRAAEDDDVQEEVARLEELLATQNEIRDASLNAGVGTDLMDVARRQTEHELEIARFTSAALLGMNPLKVFRSIGKWIKGAWDSFKDVFRRILEVVNVEVLHAVLHLRRRPHLDLGNPMYLRSFDVQVSFQVLVELRSGFSVPLFKFGKSHMPVSLDARVDVETNGLVVVARPNIDRLDVRFNERVFGIKISIEVGLTGWANKALKRKADRLELADLSGYELKTGWFTEPLRLDRIDVPQQSGAIVVEGWFA